MTLKVEPAPKTTALVGNFLTSGGFTMATAEWPVQAARDEELATGLEETNERLHRAAEARDRRQVVRLLRLKQLIETEQSTRQHGSAGRHRAS